jgi:PAS domain S-box-containing protein
MSMTEESAQRLADEIDALRRRLDEAEEMHRAITLDEVDGFVVGTGGKVRLLGDDWRPYREILERMQQGAVTISETADVLYANRCFAEMAGEPLESVFNAPLARFLEPAEASRLRSLLAGGVVNSSIDTVLRSGIGRPSRGVRVTLASLNDGCCSLLFTALDEPIERREAEDIREAIRKGQVDALVVGDAEIATIGAAHRSWAAALDHVSDGTAAISRDGDILYANERFAAMLGVSRGALLGASLARYAEKSLAPISSALQGAGAVACEVPVRRGDGTVFDARVTAFPLEEDQTACIVIADLTERKQQEALRESDRKKTQFIAITSHELRDPLAAIRAATAVLSRSRALTGRDRIAVDLIERQVRQMARMVNDLLDVARIEHGLLELRKQRVDMRSVVESVLSSSASLLNERRHALEKRLAPEAVWVSADPERLSQALANVLANAARYTPSGGRIVVTVGAETAADGRCEGVVRVRDAGVGIAPDQLGRIFEPFAKATLADGSKSSGLGLGLAICRWLLELHGGRIEARSEGIGRGTEMILRLPLAPGEAGEPGTPSA